MHSPGETLPSRLRRSVEAKCQATIIIVAVESWFYHNPGCYSFGELTLGLMDQARMSRRQGRGPRFLCPLDWFPTFPQTGKYKRRMVLHSDCIEYLATADLFPFVETVGGYQGRAVPCMPGDRMAPYLSSQPAHCSFSMQSLGLSPQCGIIPRSCPAML